MGGRWKPEYGARWRRKGGVCWQSMRRRCYDPKYAKFTEYGGRGVTVCARWRKSFANFIADMGPRPSMRHSIDRFPNRRGDYTPSNCRWATPEQQNAGRRRWRWRGK